ncbi:Maf-like protein [Zea mays]|uniref:Maf-like protein n=1 Tax=Zea mays TaxID=4577 RepID=A0A317YA98_MAIZE|nr:Maf-like protein [Zea mays]
MEVVLHDGVIREKPSTPEEARKFIKGYSESHAATIGSVLVTNVKTGARREGWDKAEVYFHKIPDEVVESLIEEGDVFYVAGGLLVEHPLTSPLVEAIVSYTCSCSCLDTDFLHGESRGHCIALCLKTGTLQVGTIDSVMGLPKALTEKLIKESLSET